MDAPASSRRERTVIAKMSRANSAMPLGSGFRLFALSPKIRPRRWVILRAQLFPGLSADDSPIKSEWQVCSPLFFFRRPLLLTLVTYNPSTSHPGPLLTGRRAQKRASGLLPPDDSYGGDRVGALRSAYFQLKKTLCACASSGLHVEPDWNQAGREEKKRTWKRSASITLRRSKLSLYRLADSPLLSSSFLPVGVCVRD